MGMWDFWKAYQQALDNFPKRELQLDREPDLNDRKISRFFFSIKRMPKAWGSKPWTSQEMVRAGNAVSNDLFRRKMKRDYLGTSRI